VQFGWSAWILRSGGGILPLLWTAAAVDFGQLLTAILLWWSRLRPRGGALQISLGEAILMARDAIPFAVAAFLGAIEARSSVLMLGYLRGETEVDLVGMASCFFRSRPAHTQWDLRRCFPSTCRRAES
jgi:O-antigen/teichoic acid export membrane protein